MKFTLLLTILFSSLSISVFAGNISGTVTDDKGNSLAYASILVKGTATGTISNDAGKYLLQLAPGRYTLSCQYVGYERVEKTITVTAANQVVNFSLPLQQTSMKEVVITAGGEDPAYDIIRHAIEKRSYYLNQLNEFQCKVYIKGQLKLRGFPKKLLGQKVEFNNGDTGKLKMLYLAETVSTYSVKKPGKVKIEVVSSRVSGQSDAFGLSQPQIFSFYENNIQIGENLNPRGFISPIAENALQYYNYKYEGSFTEDGKEINRIKVMPKRKYDPVFTGHINITENDWRIHSLQLQLTRESQMDLIDTLRLEQLYVPLNNDVWVIKSQVIYPAIKLFGFDGFGSFVNVYSDFNLHPAFPKNFFNNTLLKYTDSANKHTRSYWDSTRPVPLQADELTDYKKKDSLERLHKSRRYLDSVDNKKNKLNLMGVLVSGQTFGRQSRRATYSFISLLNALDYNTAEGLLINLQGTYRQRLDSSATKRSTVFVTPNIRYGFSNHHLNGGVTTGYLYGRKYATSFSVSGGKDVYQFNPSSPITQHLNSLSTLFLNENYMKTYEAWYAGINYNKGVGDGFSIQSSIYYQDRMPLNNTTLFTFIDFKKQVFTPNYPTEILNENIQRHQAVVASAGITWQPGAKYIEFPGRKINIGSKYPTINLSYIQGINGLLGSDVDYGKWRLMMNDDINFKLAGVFKYRVSLGGFVNTHKVQVPDYQHFNGNQSILAGEYMNSFQLAPYYQYSTTTSFYTTVNMEHHLNGLLSGRIPVLQKLNWNIVVGSNAFYVNSKRNYMEVSAGLENIFKIFRVDVVQSFAAGMKPYSGVVIGIQGALFGR